MVYGFLMLKSWFRTMLERHDTMVPCTPPWPISTASDRAMAIGKRSHRLNQLAYASNEPKDTIPRRHGGQRRPLQDGPEMWHFGHFGAIWGHLATAAAGHHGGAGWCPWARLMRTRAD